MNFNNNNKHEIKTKFRFIDNEIQGSTKGERGGGRSCWVLGFPGAFKGVWRQTVMDCVCADVVMHARHLKYASL